MYFGLLYLLRYTYCASCLKRNGVIKMTLDEAISRKERKIRTLQFKISEIKNVYKAKLMIGVKDEFQKKAIEDYIVHQVKNY